MAAQDPATFRTDGRVAVSGPSPLADEDLAAAYRRLRIAARHYGDGDDGALHVPEQTSAAFLSALVQAATR